eukprot:GEMP01038480.1.p1 GENE.GEMP01038480.1~~GEMP01038480.1.p1  ORF type:complete len:438 (-),score=111.21 GEMP01038480.1:471-1784(-)
MNTEALWKVSLKDLQTFLKSHGKNATGVKAELVAQLIGSGLGAEFSAKYPDSRAVDDETAAVDPTAAGSSNAPPKRERTAASVPQDASAKKTKQEVKVDNKAEKHKIYATAELSTMSREDLWEICTARDLSTKGSIDSLIIRIYSAQTTESIAASPPVASSSTSRPSKKPARPSPAASDTDAADSSAVGVRIGECAVCMSNNAQCAFVPCGHVCVCKECSDENDFDSCLMCRASVDFVMLMYVNFTDENPAPKPGDASSKPEKTKETKRALNLTVDAGIRPLPNVWQEMKQPACEFLMLVPWGEDSIEEPLQLRCLLCEKWATDPESHGTNSGSKEHKKKLEQMAYDTTKWYEDQIHNSRQAYLDRYPVLRRVPFEEAPEAKKATKDKDNSEDENEDEVVFMGQKSAEPTKLSDLDFLEKISTSRYPEVTLELFPFE